MLFGSDLAAISDGMPHTAWLFGQDARRTIGRAALTSGEHLTLTTLVVLSDALLRTPQSGVGVGDIRMQTRLSEGTTRRHLRRLVEVGLVSERSGVYTPGGR